MSLSNPRRLTCFAGLGGTAAVGFILLRSAPVHATVMQPSGETMPQPASPNEISCCVTNRGFPADAITLKGLFTYYAPAGGTPGGDAALDPIKDAHTTPGTFSPQCGLSGTIVLRGGGCKNALGWYNATNPPTKPAQIYPLVPADLTQPYPNGISCFSTDFCPLATRMTTQPQYTWADPLPEFAGNIRTDRRWTGGEIGFAMIGIDARCPQTKYSQAELNDKNSAGQPWITTLIYQSIADPNAYYIAFEDQPTCTASWRGCDPGTPTKPLPAGSGNDGDFNDFVFYVSGLSCKDAGKPCTVPGQMGICAGGVTECASGGMTTMCHQTVSPQPEVCDGVDNDCNGMVDDGATCPTTGFVCSQGNCVHPCDNTSEFKCAIGQQCDTDGLCKDPRCIGKACAADQRCVAGTCVGGCDGVKCPHGQSCINGNCIDPCAGVTCPAGRVCEDGACQPLCGDCRDCASGRTCAKAGDNKGKCLETGCESKTCPAGQVCAAGACQDGCTGVTCPGGQTCMMGACMPLPMPAGTGAGGTGTSGTTGLGGITGTLGTAGTTGAAASSGAAGTGGTIATGAAGTGDGAGQQHIGGVTTCKCDTAAGPGPGGVALLLSAIAIPIAIRPGRRRASRSR